MTRKASLLAATAFTLLAATSSGALAQANNTNIRINPLPDANAGSVNSLTITQGGSTGNTIGIGSTDAGAFSIRGTWDAITATQTGSGNILTGNVRAAQTATPTGTLNAAFSGIGNSQSFAVGGTTAPSNPVIAITVTGDGNILGDTLNGTSLNLTRSVTGSGNNVLNLVTATGGVTIDETIQGSGNGVSRSLFGIGSLNSVALVRGDANTVAIGGGFGGGLTAVQSIGAGNVDPSTIVASSPLVAQGSGNTLQINAIGTGTATVRQAVDGGSTPGSANGNTITANLTGVSGTTSVTQRVGDAEYGDNNTLVANLSASGQTVTMVTSGNGAVAGAGNNFTVTSDAPGGTVNATWNGGNAVININQAVTASGASATFVGYGAGVVGPAPWANVTITQNGLGNAANVVSTANPGQVLTVNVTQN